MLGGANLKGAICVIKVIKIDLFCSGLVESWGATTFAICFEDDLNNVGRACDVKLYLGHLSLLSIRTSLDVDDSVE